MIIPVIFIVIAVSNLSGMGGGFLPLQTVPSGYRRYPYGRAGIQFYRRAACFETVLCTLWREPGKRRNEINAEKT